jgi:hypothetical protein
VILDRKGNIFGGFTPAEWDSTTNGAKADPSLKSFLFTLKNPHNVAARRFALKAEKKDEAISGEADCGPFFAHGICVADNCNKKTRNYTQCFSDNYTNDTRMDWQTFFTGSPYFQVKEIEVFEITN